ncbi:MAG: DUF58 domain-containing protein [Bdellovibrionales bacterium]
MCVILGATHNNNLVYTLAFFLLGLFIIGMVQANNNLKGLELQKILLYPTQESSSGKGKVWLKSSSSDGHYQLNFQLDTESDKIPFVVHSVLARSQAIENFSYTAASIGNYKIKKIRISTVFPFGLFYSWKVLNIANEFFVFPKPLGNMELPEETAMGDHEIKSMEQSGNDYSEHKKYHPGDSLSRVDWKKYSRTDDLFIKRFEDGNNSKVELSFNSTSGSKESRQRQMAKWITDCEEKSLPYSLALPNFHQQTGLGGMHRLECLRAVSGVQIADT